MSLTKERERHWEKMSEIGEHIVYVCLSCENEFDEEHEARLCHGDDYCEAYICDNCDTLHYDADDVGTCCEPDEQDYADYLYHSKEGKRR